MLAAVGRWIAARGVGSADTAGGALAKGLTEKSAEVRRGHVGALLEGLSGAAMQLDAAARVA
eukprot:scaffold22197_cov56-Isochrysis_galbana.AAC.1